jgi:hypothetical protein
MNFNFNKFSFLFNTSCIQPHCMEILLQNDFHFTNNFGRGFVTAEKLSIFLQQFQDISMMKNCLLEWNFETILQTEICNIQSSKVFYDSISKPDAWPLDLLDQVLNNSYVYPTATSMVDLWILDTGVFWKHHEFELNQVTDVDANYTIQNISHPHGTGTACAAGGINYGTSKHIPIYNFPVCRIGGSCGSSDIEKGLIAVLNHVTQNNVSGKRSVINMSFGNYFNVDPLNTNLGKYYNSIFENITSHGGIIVVAAGNSNQDACTWLYSFSPFVVSVGSLDQSYNKSVFSNYGKCVDIWFFGSNVPLAYSTSDPNVIQYKSGTSFSSPYVAGLIVNVLQQKPNATKDEILNMLYSMKNNFVFPKYNCNDSNLQCCRSTVSGTRLDAYCKSFDIQDCPKNCVIKKCNI